VIGSLQPSALLGAKVTNVAPSYVVIAMMAYVVSDGRLFALTPSEWFLIVTGVALTGLLALLI